MKSTSSERRKPKLPRLLAGLAALGCMVLGGLAFAGPDLSAATLDGWSIMPGDTFAQLLAGLGGMGFFVVLRSKRD
ncbi:MAG: hypothetical protein IV107_06080 [Paucibacter sp.]|nr:hypothetical protein [Roseateles sp.]